jgi:hypothetical protein
LAAVASRSSLVGALLRSVVPANRHTVYDFLRGLSRDELECLAEFQGAYILEGEYSQGRTSNYYRLMSAFFDPAAHDRWRDPDARAHKMIVLLTYLDYLGYQIPAAC